MSPQAKRNAVKHLVAEQSYSERGACQLVGISRSSARYQPKEKPDEVAFRGRLRDLANGHPGYGYRRITAILRREGSDTNHKRVQRVWKSEGLQLPRRKPRKRRWGPRGEVIHKAQYQNHIWSYDFLEEHTVKGNRLRILAVIDEFTRECLAVKVARRLTHKDVLDVLLDLFIERGVPVHIRSDNGSEFIAKKVRQFLSRLFVKPLFIEPGSPWENGYIESFNGKMRDELLSGEIFYSLKEAQVLIEMWRKHYNTVRPHSSLGYRPPAPATIVVYPSQIQQASLTL